MGLDLQLLGTNRLTWRRLQLLIGHLADDEGTALFRRLDPDHATWTFPVQLLAEILNTTRTGNWMQTTDAGSKQPKHRPEPIQPPWADPPPDSDVKRYGTGHMSIEQANAWLGWDVGTPKEDAHVG